MSLLSRLTRKPKMKPLRWDTIEAGATVDHPGLVAELLRRGSDGLTITGVFTQDEIDRGLRGLEGVERIHRPFGWLLGMPIGMLGPDDPRTGYYDDNDRAVAAFRDAFGFDLHERVAAVLQPMADDMRLVAPTEGDRTYNPGQIRWWEPGGGGLPAHVGNEFRRQLQDGAMRHLLSVTSVADHLSYFVVLQRADQGGALSVYDLVWEENDGQDEEWDNCIRDDAWIDKVPSTKLDLQPGDMVVFGGGWRWHKVDPPLGDKARITYGGFAARSIEGNDLHFWA